jgi:hypothetical protein
LRNVDGLPLVAKIRQDLDEASQEDFACDQQKIKHQNGRKQAVEDSTRSSKEHARKAEIAAHRNRGVFFSGSVGDVLGLLDNLLQRFDGALQDDQMSFQARWRDSCRSLCPLRR